MKKFVLLFLVLISLSCEEKSKKSNDFNMVKQSEMAALMLKMYDVNEANKQLVLQGKVPNTIPEDFFAIHTATLTDPSDRNDAFKDYSDYHLRQVKVLYEATPQDSLISLHNNVVNSCITCHQSTCIGPIPRIKKLLIN